LICAVSQQFHARGGMSRHHRSGAAQAAPVIHEQ
jgi:hypothetical protein